MLDIKIIVIAIVVFLYHKEIYNFLKNIISSNEQLGLQGRDNTYSLSTKDERLPKSDKMKAQYGAVTNEDVSKYNRAYEALEYGDSERRKRLHTTHSMKTQLPSMQLSMGDKEPLASLSIKY